MKKTLLLLAMLTFSLSFGNETNKKYFSDSKTLEVKNSEVEVSKLYDIPADCYEVASAVLEAALESDMLIGEAYDAAYAVYETCEAIQMM